MWINLLTAIHVLVGLSIIGLVLLQRGKGADAGAGFGSGASGTVFGARGSATFFSKTTAVLVSCFFVTSLSLAYLASHRVAAPKSLLDQAPPATVLPAPQAPAAPGNPATAVPAAPVAPADGGKAP